MVNNSAMKSMGQNAPTFISNIDARGADPGLIARLPKILEERDRKLMGDVAKYFRDGTLPL